MQQTGANGFTTTDIFPGTVYALGWRKGQPANELMVQPDDLHLRLPRSKGHVRANRWKHNQIALITLQQLLRHKA